MHYLWNLLTLVSVAVNTILGGEPTETFSSRAGKAARQEKRWACIFCRLADCIQKKHCDLSIKD